MGGWVFRWQAWGGPDAMLWLIPPFRKTEE